MKQWSSIIKNCCCVGGGRNAQWAAHRRKNKKCNRL